jgi:exopolysaccharide biosynthesis polyprenyl glycosylphosphotransferase
VQAQPHKLGWPRKLRWSIIVTDAAVIALAIIIGQFARFGGDSFASALAEAPAAYIAQGVLIGIVWLIALAAARSVEHRIIGVGLAEFARVANATFVTFGVLAIVSYLLKLEIGRGYVLVALPTGLALLLLGRFFWRSVLQSMRRRGRCLTGAIIVGPRQDVARAVAQLRRNLRAGYRPIAISITDSAKHADDGLDDLPRVPVSELVVTSKNTRTRAVMVAGDLPGGRTQIRDLGWDLEDSKVELILLSRLTDVAGPRIHLRPIEGLPMVHVDLPQYTGFNHTVKRLIDIVLSGLGLLVLAPAFLVIAIAVRRDSPGPALFRQERVGVRGSRFMMLKFRSMSIDAEERLGELLDKNEGSGVLFKLKDDPRVTRVGAFLRKTSLDELPQLWNVFIGNMSLVGPRPPLQREVERYEHRVDRRLLIKPGITGLWQISGRSNMTWDEAVKIDLYYVENWSITNDFLILIRTVKAVLGRKGAY